MPGVKVKSLWALWLIVLLLLAVMPRPAAGSAGDCALNDEMAAPATSDAPTVPESTEPAPEPSIAEDTEPNVAETKASQTHPAGTHGPRTPWPDMVPMD